MAIGPIQGISAVTQATSAGGAKPSAGFADMLGKAISQLQGVSDTADAKVNAMATGQNADIADVMISLQNESLTMNLATEVRNKAVEAYQEVSRMQM